MARRAASAAIGEEKGRGAPGKQLLARAFASNSLPHGRGSSSMRKRPGLERGGGARKPVPSTGAWVTIESDARSQAVSLAHSWLVSCSSGRIRAPRRSGELEANSESAVHSRPRQWTVQSSTRDRQRSIRAEVRRGSSRRDRLGGRLPSWQAWGVRGGSACGRRRRCVRDVLRSPRNSGSPTRASG